jgi:nucleoside-diphosphate-sugar epimerase
MFSSSLKGDFSLIHFSASGFIGFPVAQALTRAGHYVLGLTRSESKAKQLAAEESTVIVNKHSHRILNFRPSSCSHCRRCRRACYVG